MLRPYQQSEALDSLENHWLQGESCITCERMRSAKYRLKKCQLQFFVFQLSFPFNNFTMLNI